MSRTFIAVAESGAFPPADQRRCRDSAILENDVARVRAALAHLVVELAEREARCSAFDDERRDAVRAVVSRIGAGHHREDAGLRRVGDVAMWNPTSTADKSARVPSYRRHDREILTR